MVNNNYNEKKVIWNRRKEKENIKRKIDIMKNEFSVVVRSDGSYRKKIC